MRSTMKTLAGLVLFVPLTFAGLVVAILIVSIGYFLTR